MPTPIFIINRDRVTVLKKCLPGYLALGDVQIIIHDNNSTYPPMIEYLKELESQGIIVKRIPEKPQDFNVISEDIADTIKEWYQTNSSPYYIVTDPDIELENPCPELLQYYIDVLNACPRAVCVGPMLRIDDLPECFKFRDRMIYSHMEQFWGPQHTRHFFKGAYIQTAAIDTTFALYPSHFEFRRLNVGVRVHEPYMARHLDWYMDTDNLTEEQQYYKDHASDVSTMSMHIRNGGM
jgi:hypothetical protein